MTYPPGATEVMREVIHSSCQWPAALQVQYAPVGSRPPPDTLSLCSLTPEPEVPAGRRRDRSNRVRDLRSVA